MDFPKSMSAKSAGRKMREAAPAKTQKIYFVFFEEDMTVVTKAHFSRAGALEEFRNQLYDVTDLEPSWLDKASEEDLITDHYKMMEVDVAS